MNIAVAEAQAALDAAKQREREDQHRQRVDELEQVTARLQEQRIEYQQLKERTLQLRARRKKLQDALTVLLGDEAQHLANKPATADYLPDSPSTAKWRQAGERLQMQRTAISQQLAETSAVDQMNVDLSRLSTEIQRLEFAQANLVSALEALKGPQPYLSAITQAPGGGISRVVWK